MASRGHARNRREAWPRPPHLLASSHSYGLSAGELTSVGGDQGGGGGAGLRLRVAVSRWAWSSGCRRCSASLNPPPVLGCCHQFGAGAAGSALPARWCQEHPEEESRDTQEGQWRTQHDVEGQLCPL